MLAPVKNNLCPAAESLAFCLRSDEEGAAARIAWEGTTPVTADRLLAAPAPDSASGGAREAEEFLRDLLAEGPIKSADVDKAARDAGIAKATLRRARDKVGVKARAVGSPARGGYWEWSLPQDVGVEDG